MRLEIKNDHMQWEDRIDLIHRLRNLWVNGSNLVISKRLADWMQLHFFHEQPHTNMKHNWSVHRRNGN